MRDIAWSRGGGVVNNVGVLINVSGDCCSPSGAYINSIRLESWNGDQCQVGGGIEGAYDRERG